jgi:hypothetical protein
MKILILVVLLASCSHSEKKQLNEVQDIAPTPVKDKSSEYEALKEEIRRLDYYINHERCFTVYSICLGEKRKASKECWANHEACVIRVYKQWMGK